MRARRKLFTALLIGQLVVVAFAMKENLSKGDQKLHEGKYIFRYDSFGSEKFWGDTLGLHKSVEAALSPELALKLGLKIDSERLPQEIKDQLQNGELDLKDPANTVALIKLQSVVGVKGVFGEDGKLKSMGISCALCHSTVDNSFAPSIGKRRDGWPNRDLDVGTIISLAQNLDPVATQLGVSVEDLKAVLTSWGPGKFDAHVFLDGKAFRPDGKSAAVVIPAAFGLSGVNLATYTGWGSITYWNAMVANNEMHGLGTFFDARLDDAVKFPIAAKAGLGHVTNNPDLVTPKLASLHMYQLSLEVPRPPAGYYNAGAAKRGKAIFQSKAKCYQCHVGPTYSEPGHNLHTAEEIGIDDFQAKRSPTERYRTTPLRALFAKESRGYYHDGRFAGLPNVIEHYDQHLQLALTPDEKSDLNEFLRSL